MHENTRAAIMEGSRRWVERMRQAKAAGLIKRFPGGRRPKGAPKLSRDPQIAKAQRIIEVRLAMAVKAGLPAKPWSELSKGEKLSANTDLSLDVTRRILELGVDASDPKTLAMVKDVALSTIAMQIKVEQGKLSFAADSAGAASPRELRIIVSADDPLLEDCKPMLDLGPAK